MATIKLGKTVQEEQAEQGVMSSDAAIAEEVQTEPVMENATVAEELIAESAQIDVTRKRSTVREGKLASDASILFEEKGKRSATRKVYRKNDGTARAVMTSHDIHYQVPGETEMREIDNTLEDKGDTYQTKEGKYQISIAKDTAHDGTLKLNRPGVSIEWNYLPDNGVNAMAEAEPDEESEEEIVLKGAKAVVYKNAAEGVDLEYKISGGDVKENIIVREKKAEYKYRFQLKLEGVVPRLAEDGSQIELIRTAEDGTEMREAVIPAPYMYDAVGNVSEQVYYEMEEDGGNYVFTVVADAAWINAEDHVLPVTIDPRIETSQTGFCTGKSQKRTRSTTSNGYTNWSKWDDYNSSWQVDYQTLTDIKSVITIKYYSVDLLDYEVASAKLVLRTNTGASGRVYVNGTSCTVSNGKLELDVTNAIKNNIAQNKNYTIEITGASGVNSMTFASSGTNAPVLYIDYLTRSLVQPTQKEIALAGGATAILDVYNGEAPVAFTDVLPSDSLLDIGISHVRKLSSEDFHCGTNFRLNLHEKLVKGVSLEGESYYVYTDSLGNQYGFAEYYYYLDENKNRVYIARSEVTISLDGKMTYGEHEVFTVNETNTGLRAVTSVDGFDDSEYIEQRVDEQKQAEDQMKSYRQSLEQMVMASRTGSISKRLSECLESNADFEGFISTSWAYLMSESEAMNIPTLNFQKTSYDDQISSLEDQLSELYTGLKNLESENSNADYGSGNMGVSSTRYPAEANEYHYQYRDTQSKISQLENLQELCDSQIQQILDKNDDYREQVRTYYKEYVNLKYKVDMYKRQLPVNYVTDGKIYKGFNEAGQLVAIYDGYNNTISIEYDEDGKIVSVYEGDDTIVFDYNDNNLLCSITDTRGRRTEYSYNTSKQLTGVKFASGKTLTISETSTTLTLQSSEKEKSVLTYSGSLTSVKNYSMATKISHGDTVEDTSGTLISSLTVTDSGSRTTLTDKDGNKVYYVFDSKGQLTEYYEEENSLVVKAEKYEYVAYEKNNVKSAKRSSLNAKAYSSFTSSDFTGGDYTNTVLDQFNNPTTKTSYQVISKTDSGTESTQQTVVTYTYDNDHKCVKETAAVTIKQGTSTLKSYTQITTYSYNASGSVVRKESYVQGEELTTGKSIEETVYDKDGHAVKSFTYNSLDSSSKFYTESEYAEDGQTVADFDETGENKTEYEYIPRTNVVRSQKLPNGSKFAYGHDVDDTVTSITQSTKEGEENSTHTRYTCGEVTELVSGNNTVQYEYDGKRRLTAVHLNGREDYLTNAYTDDTTLSGVTGKVDKCVSTNAKNESVTSYTDKQGKLRQVTLSSGKTVSYAYNTKGEVTSVTDGVSGLTETYGYDSFDRMNTYARGSEYTESYEYDVYGSVSSVTLGGGVSRTYTYAYKSNAARELESITSDGYQYMPQTDKLGRNAGREVVSGTTKIAGEYIYYRKVGDHATNMPSCVYFGNRKNGKYVISDNVKYEYDKNGNICKIYENGALTARYTYDALDRLVREDNKTFGKTYLYAYDNCGNILSRRETNFTLKEDVEECTFTSVQYAYEGDRLISVGDETCAYDEIGNPTTYRGKAVTWANGRQMTKFDTIAFAYDGQGRRRSKGSISFTYDKDGRVVKQSNGLEFIYDQSGIAGIKYNNATYFYRKDAQGNIAAILDSNGNIVVEYKYDSWGNHAVLDVNGADIALATHIGNLNPFRYRGYYYDTETGLYFLKTRYYDPEVGRFITIDDISYIDPETINGLNLYAYCGNNPVMRVDENGNAWWDWLLGAAIVVAAIALTVVTAGLAAPVSAAVGGGLLGAIVGGAVAGAVGGAITGFAFSVASQGIANGFNNINWGQVGIDTIVGMAVGGVLGGIGGGLQYLSTAGKATVSSTKEIGNYLLKDSTGKVRYTGVGSRERMMVSLRQKSKIVNGLTAEFRPAPNKTIAFAREAMYIDEFGGAISMNKLTLLLNKINSPGLKYLFFWL